MLLDQSAPMVSATASGKACGTGQDNLVSTKEMRRTYSEGLRSGRLRLCTAHQHSDLSHPATCLLAFDTLRA